MIRKLLNGFQFNRGRNLHMPSGSGSTPDEVITYTRYIYKVLAPLSVSRRGLIIKDVESYEVYIIYLIIELISKDLKLESILNRFIYVKSLIIKL